MERSADGRASILLVSQFFPPALGGSAVLLENVYSRLGRPVDVLTDRSSSPGAEGARGPFDVRLASLATPSWGIRPGPGLWHHMGIARDVRRRAGRHAVVHCARVLPEGVWAWMAHAAGGPRYVCWSHGEDLATAGASRELSLTTKLVLRGANRSLANSENTARLLRGLGVPGSEIAVARPGVDSTRFHPSVDGAVVRERHAGADDLLLLSVGRLQSRKGHDLVLRALAELSPELPRIVYVVVGTGEEEGRLRELARTCGVADRVRFAGAVPDEELPAHYAACDVFVMPNRAEGRDIEGFGIVFLEAQAAARPVIGGTSGGAPEAVADGETGILVSGDDAGELAGAVRRLAASPELRLRLGGAGRERVVRQFTWERCAESVRAVVEGMDR